MSSINYRNYPEYRSGDAFSAKRIIQDVKEFFDAFPEHPVFHCIAGVANQRYNISRKGTLYTVKPVAV